MSAADTYEMSGSTSTISFSFRSTGKEIVWFGTCRSQREYQKAVQLQRCRNS